MHSDRLVGVENTGRAEPLFVLRPDLAEAGLRIRTIWMDQDQHLHAIYEGVPAAPPTGIKDSEPRREARPNHLRHKLLPGLLSDRLPVCSARTEVNLTYRWLRRYSDGYIYGGSFVPFIFRFAFLAFVH